MNFAISLLVCHGKIGDSRLNWLTDGAVLYSKLSGDSKPTWRTFK